MSHSYRPRQDVALLLRQGATYQQIKGQLSVCSDVIAATRHAYDIPVPARKGGRIPADERSRIVARVEAMLLDGATYGQICEVVGISQPTVQRIRKELGIPAASSMRSGWTVEEALAEHVRTQRDGHAWWAGPWAGRMPQLCAENEQLNVRHVVFERYHGRPPVGYVRQGCTVAGCIAGGHLTDAVLRGTAPGGGRR